MLADEINLIINHLYLSYYNLENELIGNEQYIEWEEEIQDKLDKLT